MSDLANVQAPIKTANGSPNACYIGSSVYQYEQNALFRHKWIEFRVEKGIPQLGCVKPVNLIGRPMLLIRNWDYNINAFQNVSGERVGRI